MCTRRPSVITTALDSPSPLIVQTASAGAVKSPAQLWRTKYLAASMGEDWPTKSSDARSRIMFDRAPGQISSVGADEGSAAGLELALLARAVSPKVDGLGAAGVPAQDARVAVATAIAMM